MRSLVTDVRQFNRTWTRVLGLLEGGYLETDLTLTEARVIYELGQHDVVARQLLRDELGLDASYLTRILRRLQGKGWVRSVRSTHDRRAVDLALTESGRSLYVAMDQTSSAEVGQLVSTLAKDQQRQLDESLTLAANLVVPRALADRREIRPARPGDYGWIISRHGAIYQEMFGWGEAFEGKVAQIIGDYLIHYQPERERAWIADVNGARAGCILCCEREPGVAQLRVLLVEPWARGMGLGHQLVETCVAFAEDIGYERIVLETDASLLPALRLYQSAGFSLSTEAEAMAHGRPEDAQFWSLDLPRGA